MSKKTIKMGIFGGYRGASFYKSVLANNAEIVAVCDFNEKYANKAKEMLGDDVAVYTAFDDFIEHEGLEAVLLSNYFHEHAPYAIRLLERGIHVLSECTSNATMAQGVALVRAAEKSSAIYMLSENYPFMKFNQEMRRIYRGGSLGKVLFAEGEYNHPLDPANSDYAIELCPTSKHWRYNIPRTYYITHSLAPLMYITGAVPKRVTAMPVYDPIRIDFNGISRGVPERAAIITTLNDDDSVFRVTGCAAFGAHENSYRICAEKGQVENLRDGTGRVLLNYNKWDLPENVSSASSCYVPILKDKDAALAAAAGHGGGDFFVVREFLDCIRENKRPEFDVYFGTTMASVAILGHRSMLESGVPYDIPDFRKEEDRVKYENDNLSPFYGTDGTEPTIAATARPDYWLSAEGRAEYDRRVEEFLKARRDNEV